jgi:hypothetical protein
LNARVAIAFGFWIFTACNGDARGAETVSSPATTPTAPTSPSPPPPSPTAATADDACAHPEPRTLELALGIETQTPWALELTYAIDDDAKHGPGYMFLLRSGARRWETRRDSSNWNRAIMWRGYCWRGRGRPGVRASTVQVEVAPLCKEGKLIEMGSCAGVLKP